LQTAVLLCFALAGLALRRLLFVRLGVGCLLLVVLCRSFLGLCFAFVCKTISLRYVARFGCALLVSWGLMALRLYFGLMSFAFRGSNLITFKRPFLMALY
jgi:hypothetical protein